MSMQFLLVNMLGALHALSYVILLRGNFQEIKNIVPFSPRKKLKLKGP